MQSNFVDKVVRINISRGLFDEVTVDVDRFEENIVYDNNGQQVRFGDIYKNKKTIVVFLRHPQCYVAKEYMEDLVRIPDRFLEQANVQLVTVGPHAVPLLSVFKEETGFRHAMYCDPSIELYKAVGFKCDAELQHQEQKSGVSRHVKSSWISGILQSTYRTAVWYRDFRADMRINGGVLVLGPGRVLHSSHLDKGMYDQMPINSLLQLVCGVTMSFPGDRRILHV